MVILSHLLFFQYTGGCRGVADWLRQNSAAKDNTLLNPERQKWRCLLSGENSGAWLVKSGKSQISNNMIQ